MDIDVFAPRELPTVFATLRTAMAGEGPLFPEHRKFLETYGRIVGWGQPAFDPGPVSPWDVHISTPHRRKRLLQLAAIAALLNHPVRAGSVDFLKALAQQLATHDSVVDVIEALHQGRTLKVKLLARRRAFRVMFKEAYLAEGLMGVVRFAAAILLKAPVNRDKLWGYKKLGLLPDGTLGREYWKHMTTVGFGFPGEPAGIASSVAYHDVAHVLADHDITGHGEIQQGCFQGGNRREDGFFFIQFVILHFHHGVQITPAAPAEHGHFDPVKVLWAIHRGAQCNVDFTHQWNYWPLMDLPIEEARERVGLMPHIMAA
jgi:hypothetical protein